MAGFDNDVMYANNADFSTAGAGSGSAANGLQTDGQLWTGTTAANVGGTHVNVGVLTSPNGTVQIGYSSPNITLDVTGGANPIEKVNLQTGTSPIVPSGGIITFNGAVVAAGTNPVRTDGTGANTMALEVQTSQALAATDATKIGLSNFDSAAFDVDANGFVQLNGGGIAATSITVDANTAPGTNPVVPTAAGGLTIEAAAVAAHSVPIETRSRAANTFKVEVQEAAAVAATDITKSGIAHYNSAQFTVDANGFVSASGTIPIQTTENSGTATPSAGNLNILGTNSALTGYSPWTTGSGSTATLNMPGTVKWVVNATANLGTHTTIQAAVTAAASGDDVFITAGTYTENVTLKAGVNLVAYGADNSLNGTGNVQITGKLSFSSAGTVSITGIQLNTNSDNFLAVTGSAASIVALNNCYLNCSNNTGISFTTANTSAFIYINNCYGNIGTTGIAYFSDSSTGTLSIQHSNFGNSGSSSTVNTKSAGVLSITKCTFTNPITYSSSNTSSGIIYTNLSTANNTCVTTSGTGVLSLADVQLNSGSASALSIGTGTTVAATLCVVNSSNTNAITGAGSATLQGVTFTGSSHQTNVTTQTGGAMNGLTQGTAPSVGMIGEQLTANASAVATTSSTAKTITSISLTPGIWDITGSSYAIATGGTLVMSVSAAGISTTTNTLSGTGGIDFTQIGAAASTMSVISIVVPTVRATLSATTTYYLVVTNVYTSTTCPTNAKITATRVG